MASLFKKSKIGRHSQTRIVKRVVEETPVTVQVTVATQSAVPSRFETRTEPFNGFASPRGRF